jgi:hypothetical protein
MDTNARTLIEQLRAKVDAEVQLVAGTYADDLGGERILAVCNLVAQVADYGLRDLADALERAATPDATQADNPHVDRLVELITRSLGRGGCSNCGGLPHTTTCRVGRLAQAFAGDQTVKCPDCKGTGLRAYAREVTDGCDRCNATGRVASPFTPPAAPRQLVELLTVLAGPDNEERPYKSGVIVTHEDARVIARGLLESVHGPRWWIRPMVHEPIEDTSQTLEPVDSASAVQALGAELVPMADEAIDGQIRLAVDRTAPLRSLQGDRESR